METVECQTCWTPWDGPGLEPLRLTEADGWCWPDGLIVGCNDAGRPFRARFWVRCDAAWRVREV